MKSIKVASVFLALVFSCFSFGKETMDVVEELENCSAHLKLEGIIESYEKVAGKIQKAKYYILLGENISPHMGVYRNIRLPKDSEYSKVEVGDKIYNLKIQGEYKLTQGLYLTKHLIEEAGKEHFKIKLIGKERSCIKIFEGAHFD